MTVVEQIKELLPIVQVISVIFAAFSVLIAAIGLFRTAIINQRQINARVFLECVKRYDNILESFPSEARLQRFNPEQAPPENSQTTYALLRYLNLCSEEFYLKRQGYFSEKIWETWQDILKRTMQSALFKREWPTLKEEFISDQKFINFIQEELNSSSADKS